MTDTDLVRYDVVDGVATVTLHNPDRKNAWSVAMEHQYFARLDDAAADDRGARDRRHRRRERVLPGDGHGRARADCGRRRARA